jgi:hypothetical protein
MIADLQDLNRLIVIHSLGSLNDSQSTYLDHAAICVGRLVFTAQSLKVILSELRTKHRGGVPLVELNRRYLQFARLAAKEAAAKRSEPLLALGIAWDDGEFFAAMSDQDIEALAFGLGTPIVRLMKRQLQRAASLHEKAGMQHASAFVSVRPALKRG